MKKSILALSIAATSVFATSAAADYTGTEIDIRVLDDSQEAIFHEQGYTDEQIINQIEQDLIDRGVSPAQASAFIQQRAATRVELTQRAIEIIHPDTGKPTNPTNPIETPEKPVDGPSVPELPVGEEPVKPAPIEDMPIVDAPIEDMPIVDAPVEDQPTVTDPAKDLTPHDRTSRIVKAAVVQEVVETGSDVDLGQDQAISSLEQAIASQAEAAMEYHDNALATTQATVNARPMVTDGSTAFGAGVGAAGDSEAISVGVAHSFEDSNWSASATATGTSETTYVESEFSAGAGVQYTFN